MELRGHHLPKPQSDFNVELKKRPSRTTPVESSSQVSLSALCLYLMPENTTEISHDVSVPSSETTTPASSSLIERMNTFLLPILTPENIDSFREQCPVQVATNGVMGIF